MNQLQEVNIRNYEHLKNETLQFTKEKPPSSFILSCVELQNIFFIYIVKVVCEFLKKN